MSIENHAIRIGQAVARQLRDSHVPPLERLGRASNMLRAAFEEDADLAQACGEAIQAGQRRDAELRERGAAIKQAHAERAQRLGHTRPALGGFDRSLPQSNLQQDEDEPKPKRKRARKVREG